MSSSNTISSSCVSFSDKDQDEFDAEEDIGEEEKKVWILILISFI